MTGRQLLPAAFAELECFVAHWAGKTTDDRVHARSSSSLAEIRTFYDAMVPRLEEAIEHIDAIGLNALPPDSANLARLVLGLGQASISVEIHDAAIKPGTTFPHGIKVSRGPVPFG